MLETPLVPSIGPIAALGFVNYEPRNFTILCKFLPGSSARSTVASLIVCYLPLSILSMQTGAIRLWL